MPSCIGETGIGSRLLEVVLSASELPYAVLGAVRSEPKHDSQRGVDSPELVEAQPTGMLDETFGIDRRRLLRKDPGGRAGYLYLRAERGRPGRSRGRRDQPGG